MARAISRYLPGDRAFTAVTPQVQTQVGLACHISLFRTCLARALARELIWTSSRFTGKGVIGTI